MPIGITNTSQTTLQNLTDIANVTTFPEFMTKVNHIAADGYLYFILLLIGWIILFVGAQQVQQSLAGDSRILNNLMYSGAIISVISLLLRAIEITNNGVIQELLTDKQMWFFPIVTTLIAGILWITKD